MARRYILSIKLLIDFCKLMIENAPAISVPRSSSGLGRHPLTVEIRGSNPLRGTIFEHYGYSPPTQKAKVRVS